MAGKLTSIFKSRRTRALEAEISELRVAIAGILAAGKTPEGVDTDKNEIDAVLFHAAGARVEAERLRGLYEAAMARIAALEARMDAAEKSQTP